MTNLDPKHIDALVDRVMKISMDLGFPSTTTMDSALARELCATITALRAENDRERGATIEAAARICWEQVKRRADQIANSNVPDWQRARWAAGRIQAELLAKAVEALHTDATRAAMDAIRRKGYEAGVAAERAKSADLANAARDLADCCQLGEDADWDEGDDPLSELRSILAARS